MTLTAALASAVSQQAKDRGETYYRQGKVEIVDGSRSFVEAYVQGGEEYKVLLERQGNNLFVSCLCPYAQENITPCKHVWATILAAEASGYLGSVSGKRGLKLLVCPDLEDELEGADAAWEEDGGEEDQVLFEPPRPWSPTPSAPFSKSPYPKAQRPPSATTSQWKDQLEANSS